MKYSDSILFACAIICIGIIITPLLDMMVWLNYLLVAAAGILAGAGFYVREKRRNEEQNEIASALKEAAFQQKELLEDVVNSNKQTNTSLQDLKAVMEEIKHSVQVEMKEFQAVSERNSSRLYEILEQKAADVLQGIQSANAAAEKSSSDMVGALTKSSQQLSENIVSVLTEGNAASADFFSKNNSDMRNLKDSIHDLESKVGRLLQQVIDELEDGHDLQAGFYDQLAENAGVLRQQYDDLNENMDQYQIQVKRAAEDIEEYRDHTEEDISIRLEILMDLIGQLTEATNQLADSKHHEREQALQVQKQLTKQFERLKVRG